MWIYDGKEFKPTPEELEKYFGFVYTVYLPDGKQYVGKKQFWKIIKRPPLKSATSSRKRKCKVQSDWMKYWGSNDKIKADISENGTDKYKREILLLVEGGKGILAMRELEVQVKLGVLFSDDYANGILNIRLNKTTVAGYKPLYK